MKEGRLTTTQSVRCDLCDEKTTGSAICGKCAEELANAFAELANALKD